MHKDAWRLIVEEKKKIFVREVENSSELLSLSIPKIKFLEYHEPDIFTKGERAHINLVEKTIYISEQELKKMDFEEIRNTASHEVIHLIHVDHDDNFWNLLKETQVNLWNPPSGLIVVGIGKKVNLKETIKSKHNCNFNFCNVKDSKFQCPYCMEHFCKEHLIPQEPSFDKRFIHLNMPPCFPYLYFLQEEKKRIEDRFGATLETEFSKGID